MKICYYHHHHHQPVHHILFSLSSFSTSNQTSPTVLFVDFLDPICSIPPSLFNDVIWWQVCPYKYHKYYENCLSVITWFTYTLLRDQCKNISLLSHMDTHVITDHSSIHPHRHSSTDPSFHSYILPLLNSPFSFPFDPSSMSYQFHALVIHFCLVNCMPCPSMLGSSMHHDKCQRYYGHVVHDRG